MLRPGDHIGSYCLVAPIGRGGQSSIWRALDAGGNQVALKVLHIRNDETLERLRREAAALATVHHPSLVRCSLLVEDPNRAVAALVLELVEGAPLAEVLARGPIPPQLGEWILRHVAGALAAIHAAGHVHRDLTTRNVLVRPQVFSQPADPACVKVIDLGIAAIVGNPKPLTDVDAVVGTAPYLPPEIVDPETWPGQPARPCGDVFAFGVLAMEVLHGRRPAGVVGEHTPLAYAKAYAPFAESPSGWPPDLPADRHELLLRRCLALRAADRPRDGAEVVELVRATCVDLETTEKAPALGPVAPVRPMRTMPDADAPGESPPPTLRDARVTWRAFGVAFAGAAAVLGVLVFALTRPARETGDEHANEPKAPALRVTAMPPAVVPSHVVPAPPPTATAETRRCPAGSTLIPGAQACIETALVTVGRYSDGHCGQQETDVYIEGASPVVIATEAAKAPCHALLDRQLSANCVDWEHARACCRALRGRLPAPAEVRAARLGGQLAALGRDVSFEWTSENATKIPSYMATCDRDGRCEQGNPPNGRSGTLGFRCVHDALP